MTSARRRWIAIGLFVLLAAFLNMRGVAPATTAQPAVAQVAWWPAGFTVSPQDPAVAYRWLKAGEFACTYSGGGCWGMYVVPRDGCRTSLYVELSLTDAAGNAIGYTNDTAGAVTPGQQAKMVFDSLDPTAREARLTDVTCY